MVLLNFWRITLIPLASLFLLQNIHSQNSLNELDIVFAHDYENNTTGNYLSQEWSADWLYPEWVNRQSELDIVRDASDIVNASKAMRVYFPAYSLGPEEGGTHWPTDLPGKYDELYFSYDVKFMPGFEFQSGGKLPGLKGGSLPSTDKPDGYDGFGAFIMFKANRPMFYIYYPDAPQSEYGFGLEWGKEYAASSFGNSKIQLNYASGPVYLATNKWHNLTFRVVLNSLNSSGSGNYDGILEAFYDGQLVSQVSHVLFRHTDNLSIDKIIMMTFFGGSTDDYRNPISEWVEFDNFLLYTFKSDVSVPRGHQLSPTTRTINYWRDFKVTNTEAPSAPGSIQYSNVTNSSASLKWQDNSNIEYGFEIYRSQSENDGFSLICTTTSNVTSYIDRNLESGKTYYYRIRAFNDAGPSDYAQTTSVGTLAVLVPSMPTDLSATSITYFSALIFWTDNSVIETGYEIERTGPENESVVKRFTTGPNTTSYTDKDLKMSATYHYRVRAFSGGTYSEYSSPIVIMTPSVQIPSAPTALTSSDYTENSITISWNDNSNNENGFIITRAPAIAPNNTTEIPVVANSSSYTDNSLNPNTSYVYSIKAINLAGNSTSSNKDVASTMSLAETKRVREGLIAYYNFAYNPSLIIRDLSGFGEPLNLKVQSASAVNWNKFNRLQVNSNTSIISTTPAYKILNAIKRTGEITVECWIRPFEPYGVSAARVVSLGFDDSRTGFILDQYYSNEDVKKLNYGIRLQTESTTQSGFPELSPEKSLTYLNLQHIVYVRDTMGLERLYINGNKASEGLRSSNFGTWNNDFYLRLANEKDLRFPWKGTLYSLAIFNKALSKSQVEKNFSLGPCDSVINKSQNFSLSVYPNPATDLINIQIDPNETQDFVPYTYFRVVDIYGKLYHNETLFNPNYQTNVSFDVSRFPKGIYFVQIISGSTQKTQKIVIQ